FKADSLKRMQAPKIAAISKRPLPKRTPNVISLATNKARNIKSFTTAYAEKMKVTYRESNNYQIEIFRKFTQSAACIIMFLIGAPLGAIIKKGGLGMPVLISILFFIIFYV